MTAVLTGDTCRVAYGISNQDPIDGAAIPLTLGPSQPRAFLDAYFRLKMDREREHLEVAKSSFGAYLDDERKRLLFRYDFDRSQNPDYPEAHLHVGGRGRHFKTLLALKGKQKRPLKRLHFPVGGKRFRPTLEDAVEFLVKEGLADGRPGWQAVVDAYRERWMAIQLRAAIRRYPEIARDQLDKMGG